MKSRKSASALKVFPLLLIIIVIIPCPGWSNKTNAGIPFLSYCFHQKFNADTGNTLNDAKDSIPKTGEQLFRQMKKIIANTFDLKIETIKMESNFTDDLHADDLDMVELIMQFEDHFNIKVPDEDAGKFITVKDAYDYFLKKLRIK